MYKEEGDFKYNGIPIFKVNFSDFSYIVSCFENGSRVISKNLMNEQLKDCYKKSRNHAFGVFYEGVMLDFRDLKKHTVE
jgi:hypothetical protein